MTTVGLPRVGVVDTRRDDVTVLPAVLKRTAWGAIFVGAIAAIGVQLILTVLGVAIGISAVDRSDSAAGVGMAAGVWWLVTGIVSLLVGGAVLGRTAGIQRSIDVLLHAFAMWALTAICGFLLVWATASVASTAGSNMAGSIVWNPGYMGGRTDLGPVAGRQGAGDRSEAVDRDRAAAGPSSLDGERLAGDRATTADRSASLREPTAAEAEEARKAARAASWWTLGGLLMGVGAALAGAWFATSDRLIIRPPSVAAP